MQLDRTFYIPARSQKFTFTAAGVTVYAFTDSKGRPCARFFVGKAAKPAHSYAYRDEAHRKSDVMRYVESRARIAAEKQAYRDSLKGAHSLQVGDILYTSGGWEQTRCSFYQVVARTASTIQVYPIRKEHLEGGEYSYWKVAPVRDSLITTVRKWVRDADGSEVCRDVPCEPQRVRVDVKDRASMGRQGLYLHCRADEPVGSRSESGHH